MNQYPRIIEATAKRWKLVQVIGVAVLLIGAGTCIHAMREDRIILCVFGMTGILFGLPTWIIGRFGAWWFHG